MAWTAPRTFVAGEILTAAIFNTDHRDNLLALSSFAAFTPTWTGSTTNPVLGNGTLVARALLAGKKVEATYLYTMGSTTTYGSGFWLFTFPVTMLSGNGGPVNSAAMGSDTSAPLLARGMARPQSTTTFCVDTFGNTVWSAAVPYAWAVSDIASIAITGEAA